MRSISCGLVLAFASMFAFSFTAKAQVNADFSASATEGCGSLVVFFTDLSTGTPAAPDTWLWDFGDGSPTSSLQDASHFYAAPGTYTVTLTASIGADSDTETKTAFITVYQEPEAVLSASPTAGCLPLDVSFTDNSVPGDGTINDWVYNLGNGSTATTQNPQETYNTAGTYTVSLLVTDDNGCTSDSTFTDLISVTDAPVANFSVDAPFSCTSPHTVTITDNSTGTGLVYDWDFGDGTTDNVPNPAPHTYNNFGNYTITLIVGDGGVCQDTMTQQVTLSSYQASFTSDVTSGCTGTTVNFQDQSPASANVWLWDFGDGTTSTAQNPTHIYNAPGTYTVSMGSADPSGCGDTVIVANYITIFSSPTVSFASNDSSSCLVPFTVNFSASSPTATQFAWDFGDGGTATTQNPTHSYTALGTYTVVVVATDGNGCSVAFSQPNFINVTAISANFFATPTTGICIGDTLQFVNTSNTGGGALQNISWNFGDGSPIVNGLQTPQHAYADSGVYDITVIIENDEGCTDTLVSPGYARIGMKPTANYTPVTASTCYSEPQQYMDASSSWVDTWNWTFTGTNGIATSTAEDPQITFTDTGFFDISLIVGHYGCNDTIENSAVVEVLLPIADFVILNTDSVPDINHCELGDSSLFFDMSAGADTWLWDFGAANNPAIFGAQFPPFVEINQYGNNNIQLIVNNLTTGCADTAVNVVRVSERDINFGVDTTAGCNPTTINFFDSSFANYGYMQRFWWFGDGDTLFDLAPAPVSHLYDTAGDFTTALWVMDNLGCLDSIIFPNLIDIKGLPTAAFTSNVTVGCEPLDVQFTNQSTAAPQSTLASYSWNFGNGGTSTAISPDTSYTPGGQYTVSLTVVDNFNCSASITETNYITVTQPYTDFTFPPAICNGTSVNFTNLTTPTAGVIYSWDFGDSSPLDSTMAPSHTYDLVGDTSITLPVTLTVVDTNGCDSVVTQNVVISIPVANPVADSAIADCPPFTATFTDSSSTDVISWLWDFGDSTIQSTDTNPTHFYPNAGIFDITLIVSNALGCTDTARVDSLIRISGPSGSFSDSLYDGTCFGGVSFVSETQDAALVQWIFGDGGSATGDTVFYQYSQSGTFTPVMNMVDSAGCEVPVIGSSITIPVFNIDAQVSSDSTSVLAGTPIVFFDDGSNSSVTITEWYWDFGDSTTVTATSAADQPHTYNEIGTYTTMLVITDQNGCVDTAMVTVSTFGGVQVPNVFSPNGDGINDEFLVPSSGVQNFNIVVFNRWGEILYESTRPNQGWDGRTFAGDIVPPGTYYYVLSGEDDRGNALNPQQGTITLFR